MNTMRHSEKTTTGQRERPRTNRKHPSPAGAVNHTKVFHTSALKLNCSTIWDREEQVVNQME